MSFGYHISFKPLDKGCFEILGPVGIPSCFMSFTYHISNSKCGMMHHCTVMMLKSRGGTAHARVTP